MRAKAGSGAFHSLAFAEQIAIEIVVLPRHFEHQPRRKGTQNPKILASRAVGPKKKMCVKYNNKIWQPAFQSQVLREV